MRTLQPTDAARTYGRDAELARIFGFLEQVRLGGGALVIQGDEGAGRSTLLACGKAEALSRGFHVMSLSATTFESGLPYSGLHQLFYRFEGQLAMLEPAHRRALGIALGFESSERHPERLLLAQAVLALLRSLAAQQPLLIALDDLQWLDEASSELLGFVVRRGSGHRVGVLATATAGISGNRDWAELPCLRLGPLDAGAACGLLDAAHPELTPQVSQRILKDAEGSPLALVELPGALSRAQRMGLEPLPQFLPLGDLLRAKVAPGFDGLSSSTRHLLLVAALDRLGDPGVLALFSDAVEALVAAERAGIIEVDGRSGRLQFRRVLGASAVVEASTELERRHAHEVLSEIYAHVPDHLAWHLAESAIIPDARVSAGLERSALNSLRLGDVHSATSAMLRSAELSPGSAERGRRLAMAAYIGANVTGDLRTVVGLIEKAQGQDTPPATSLALAIAAAHLSLNGDSDLDTAHRLLASAVASMPRPYRSNDHLVCEGLFTLAQVCHFAGRPQLWQVFDDLLNGFASDQPPLLSLLVQIHRAPSTVGPTELAVLDGLIASLHAENDPTVIVRTSTAAFYVDRLPDCAPALGRVLRSGREGGAVACALEALGLMMWDRITAGDWTGCRELAAEQSKLCAEHGFQVHEWPELTASAFVEAALGRFDLVSAACSRMAAWGGPRGARALTIFACNARVLAALGEGDYEEAYCHTAAVIPAGTSITSLPHGLWRLQDTIEALARSGRIEEARREVQALLAAGVPTQSQRLAMLTWGSAGLVAEDDDEAVTWFAKALSVPGAERWSFDLARIRLNFGMRLRRGRAQAEAAAQLAAALAAFHGAGATPWARRTEAELRALGVTSVQRAAGPSQPLSAQEAAIAALAAEGLTNRQIADQVFLSHRTVGAHLYQIFRKLGISSRAALRDSLDCVHPVSSGSKTSAHP